MKINIKTQSRRGFSKHHFKKFCWTSVRAILLIGLSFVVLFPLLVKISATFKSSADLIDATVYFIPRSPTMENLIMSLKVLEYPSALLYTIGLSALIAILQTASCTFVAYGFARFKFKGKGILFALVILTFIIPPQSILLPLYIKFNYFSLFNLINVGGEMSGVSLINTIWPFIMMSSTAVAFRSGLYIFLLRQFFVNMPVALEDAASIDGCNAGRTFISIMIPGAATILATSFLFSFVWQWNDYYYSQLLAPTIPTLSMRINNTIASLQGSGSVYYANVLQNPMLLLLIVPLIIVYIFTQRFFVESIEKSGIVG